MTTIREGLLGIDPGAPEGDKTVVHVVNETTKPVRIQVSGMGAALALLSSPDTRKAIQEAVARGMAKASDLAAGGMLRRAAAHPALAAPYGGSSEQGTDTNDTRVDEQRELALETRTDHVAAIFRDAIADYFRATGWGHVCAQPIGNGDFRVTACGIKGVELAWVKVYSGASDDWMRVWAAKMREAINAKIPMPAPTGLAPADSSQRGRPWGL